MNDLPHTRRTSVPGFVNDARSLLGLHDLPCIWLAGTVQDDETNCIVANALGLRVGASDHDHWTSESKWVMGSPAAGQIVGFATELDWRANPAEAVRKRPGLPWARTYRGFRALSSGFPLSGLQINPPRKFYTPALRPKKNSLCPGGS